MNWDLFWDNATWDYFDKIGIAASLVAMLFSILIWLNQKRREKQEYALLDICLHCSETNQCIKLVGQIRRKNLTRAEVQGLLGILPMKEKGKRYDLPYLNQKAFFDALEDAQVNGELKELIIFCTDLDLEQFDLSVINI